MHSPGNRWFILAVCVLANICQGVAYTSSIFMLPLGKILDRPQAEWSREWGLIFAMTLAFLPVGMILSGKLADLGKTRLTIGLGTLLYCGGLVLAGYGTSVLWIAATLGMMTSVGSGGVYGTILGAAVRWFPDKRGLASGIAAGAVAIGPIILAPLTGALMAACGVMNMFKILGIICFVFMGLAAVFVRNPEPGYAPAGWDPARSARPAAAAAGLTWRQMIRQPLFWLLWTTYFCGVFSGVLVSGLAAPIAIELAGFRPEQAVVPVMTFALSNACGRVLWGCLSDLAGRLPMIAAAFVLTAAAAFTLYWHVGTAGVFLPCLAVVGLCYGGAYGTFPSLSADSFGLKHAALNLAVLITSLSIVAFLAPQVIGHYRAAGTDRYATAFLVAACVACAGIGLSAIVGITHNKRFPSNSIQ